jgi:hypothetical protein
VSVGITVADDTFFQAQVLDGGGGAATPLSDCEDPGSLTGSPAYRGNGTVLAGRVTERIKVTRFFF